jgi:hypothetical protein
LANRMNFVIVLTLALSLSPHLAQALPSGSINGPVTGTPSRSPMAGNSETGTAAVLKNSDLFATPQFTRIKGSGRFGLTPLSPPLVEALLPPAVGEAHSLPLFPALRFSRLEPGSLPDRLLEQAQRYLHTPYRRGCSLQTGRATDCSGFVQYIYNKANISLPRASAEQAQVGKVAARSMDFSKLVAGDLLFFSGRGRHIDHVGIYLGGGRMIHASSHRRGVIVSDLQEPYYHSNFVVAKRLLEGTPGGPVLARSSGRPSLN